YESKWDDLKVFIQYGVITEEKFAEKAEGFLLVKNTEGAYYTMEEYKEKVKENQTDKHGTLIYLYTNDVTGKYSFVECARSKGYDVLVMDGQLDNHFVNWYENKNQQTRFVRVDSDVIEKLIQKDSNLSMSLSTAQQETLRPVFEAQLPAQDDKIHYNVTFEALDASASPVVITQNEYMRRMKDMAAAGGGGGMAQFYGQMPDNYTIAVNGNHPLVVDILDDVESKYGDKLAKVNKKIDAARSEQKALDEVVKGKKDEEITTEEKDKREELEKRLDELTSEKNSKLRQIGSETPLVKQLVDLALLSNGMLKGESLDTFIRRSVELIGK
ncbi:MAG: molecular chaperone HtpG, partial [Rikenellaceae bacterium]|nr:molecular chaperone HtpG [Rikenellaceae bacterium]